MKNSYLIFLLFTFYACNFQQSGKQLKSVNKHLLALTDSISHLMSEYHYNPAELSKDEYLDLEKKIRVLAKKCPNKKGIY